MADSVGRYRLVDIAQLEPGVDFFTKSSAGPFIDTGIDVEVAWTATDQRVYLTVDTVRELAQMAGISTKNAEDVGAEIEAAREEGYLRGLKESVVANLGDSLDYLRGILAAASGPADDAVPEAAEVAGEPVPEELGEDAGVEPTEPDAGDGQPVGDEPEPAPAPRQGSRSRRQQGQPDVPDHSGDGINPFS